MIDWPAVRKELTPKRLAFSAIYGIIAGFSLYLLIRVFYRSRYLPVMFVLLFLIIILADVLWLHKSMAPEQIGPG